MNAYQLLYKRLQYFEMCPLLSDLFSDSLNYQQGATRFVFVSTNEKRLQNHVYRQIKSKLIDIFGSGKSSPFERVDFSVYHFLSSFSKSK